MSIQQSDEYKSKNICIQENVLLFDEKNLNFGRNIHIGRGTEIMASGGVTLGNNVIISFNCVLWSIDHNYEGELLPYDFKRLCKPIVIGDNVWIGRNSIVRGGVTIGEGAVVSIGSVVTRNVPPLAVVGGNPACLIKFRDVKRYEELKSFNANIWNNFDGCGACESPDYFIAKYDERKGTRNKWLRWLRNIWMGYQIKKLGYK